MHHSFSFYASFNPLSTKRQYIGFCATRVFNGPAMAWYKVQDGRNHISVASTTAELWPTLPWPYVSEKDEEIKVSFVCLSLPEGGCFTGDFC